MPHSIERKAKTLLIKELKRRGYKVEFSDRNTFDLIVDGKYAEMKSKKKSFPKMDFISLTKNQFEAIKKYGYNIFLVCGANEQKPEIFIINAKDLLKKRYRKIVSYEFDKTTIDKIKRKLR